MTVVGGGGEGEGVVVVVVVVVIVVTTGILVVTVDEIDEGSFGDAVVEAVVFDEIAFA